MPGTTQYAPINTPITGRCMVCGDKTPEPKSPDGTGRPRRYCSARCKQRGYRLRRASGDDWWRTQPWRVEFDRDHAEQAEAAAAAAKLKADAMALLPPETQKRIRAAEFQQWMHAIDTATKYRDRAERRWKKVDGLSDDILMAAMRGEKLRFGDPCDDERIAGVLNHAVACASEVEAQTFFDKARRLWSESAHEGVPSGETT